MILMQGCIDDHQEWLNDRGTSPATRRAYRSDLSSFAAWCGGELDLDRAGAWLVEHFEEWSPATVLRRRAAIRSLAKFTGTDVLDDFRSPQPLPGQSHPIPEGIDGVHAMVATARFLRHKASIGLMGYCGLRLAEAIAVRPSDFTKANDGLHRLQVHGKGRKERLVVIHAPVWELMRPVLRDDEPIARMGERVLRKRVSDIGFKALGHHVAPHDLRHTAGTAFYYASGRDIRATQQFLGHSTSAVTERYIGIADATLASGADFWKETA